MKDKLLKKKWLITPKKALTATKREKYWVSSHRNKAYGDVFSITEDEACRARIMTALNEVGKVASVLVPGCGSRTFLQETLVQCHAIRKICCTDFAGVVQIAKQHFMHPKVQYLARNSTKLGFENEWDAVVVINSVLSESDKENRLMLSSFCKALRPDGVLIGYFPTILCALDIDHLDSRLGWTKRIDMQRNSFYEPKQRIHQIFYTPLRLRYIIKEAGFNLEKMEIHFCDSDYFIKHGAKYYGLRDKDAVIYSLFVVARKERLL